MLDRKLGSAVPPASNMGLGCVGVPTRLTAVTATIRLFVE
jgi:hypothetical protein